MMLSVAGAETRGIRSRYKDDRAALAADAGEYGRICHDRLNGKNDMTLSLSPKYIYTFRPENIKALAAS